MSNASHYLLCRPELIYVSVNNYTGTESCIRLVDVDQDGVLDIIMGVAMGKDVSQMVTEESMDKFCKSLGKFSASGLAISSPSQSCKYIGMFLYHLPVFFQY